MDVGYFGAEGAEAGLQDGHQEGAVGAAGDFDAAVGVVVGGGVGVLEQGFIGGVADVGC